MTREFIETDLFINRWSDMGLTDDDLAELEDFLCMNPQAGEVVPGTGGLRKMRIPIEGRGKRSGARIAYVDFVIQEKTILITAYTKNEKTDFTSAEKKAIKAFIEKMESELT